MTDSREQLAAMRAAGWQVAPQRSIASAAAAAGRTLVELTDGRLTLGWLDGSEPVAGGDSGVLRFLPAEWLVLVFAAALRLCWADTDEHPYPGRATTDDDILSAVGTLGPLRGGVIDGLGSLRHQKGALPKLRAGGFLTADADGHVRLGHRVAAWTEREIASLRHVADLLPSPTVESI